MNLGSTVFAQLMAPSSRFNLHRCIRRYRGNHRVRSFSCRDQFLAMAFARLTYRESLRDIDACLGALPERCYHLGIRGAVSRSTTVESLTPEDFDRRREIHRHGDEEIRMLAGGSTPTSPRI